MSNSWSTTSQSSPGFVYFATETPAPESEKLGDYVAFSNDSSPARNNFNPSNYSSPQQQQRQQWGSPRNFNNRNRHNHRYSNPNQSFSPNKTYNSSFNRNNSNQSFGKHNHSKGEKTFNKNKYLHPSFMENPWATLEAKLKQRRVSQIDDTDVRKASSTSRDCYPGLNT